MASKKTPPEAPKPSQSPTPSGRPDKDAPVRTQMVGEHGDDDIGYDPSAIPVEEIPED